MKCKLHWAGSVHTLTGCQLKLFHVPCCAHGASLTGRCSCTRNLKLAGLGSFWELLQHYPRDHITLCTTLQEGQVVELAGRVSQSKSFSIPRRDLSIFEAWVNVPSAAASTGASPDPALGEPPCSATQRQR